MSSLAELYKAIKFARPRPQGIAVSTEMWEKLKRAGVIQMTAGHSLGMFRNARFPAINGDIPVIINPALDVEGKAFILSDAADEPEAAPRRLTERQRTAEAA